MRALTMAVLVGLVGCDPVAPGWDGGGYTDEEDAPVLGDVPPAPEPDCTGVLEGAYPTCPEGFTAGCRGGYWWNGGTVEAWTCDLHGGRSECRSGTPRCGATPAACVPDQTLTLGDGTRVECP